MIMHNQIWYYDIQNYIDARIVNNNIEKVVNKINQFKGDDQTTEPKVILKMW